ncbi:hypothetical protein D3C80_1800380 [compost metagenome]
MQALTGEEDAGPGQLLVVLAHGREQFRARHDAGFRFLGCFDNHHEAHCCSPVGWHELQPAARAC